MKNIDILINHIHQQKNFFNKFYTDIKIPLDQLKYLKNINRKLDVLLNFLQVALKLTNEINLKNDSDYKFIYSNFKVNFESVEDLFNRIQASSSVYYSFPDEIKKGLDSDFLKLLEEEIYTLDTLVRSIKKFNDQIDVYKSNIAVYREVKLNAEKDLKKLLDSTVIYYENKIKNLDQDLSRLLEQQNAIVETNEEIKNEISSMNIKVAKIDKSTLNLDGKIIKYEQEMNHKLEKLLTDAKASLADSSSNIINEFKSKISLLADNADKEIASIKDTSKSFSEFVSDETAIRMTDNYKSKSVFEMWTYYFFTFLSALIILVAIYLSWHALDRFTEAHKDNNFTQLDLIFLAIRLIFSVLIFSTVAFTSRLAARSYQYWKKNEGIYLRLTALKPFIADMSLEKKREIHEKLIDVYFGKDNNDSDVNEKIKDLPKNITDLLGKVVDNVASFGESVTSKKDKAKLDE